ncbi:macrophage mannose receptor 1-like [Betta splendens]|uniref:Macrophage mannose receptor 1-like n=1 Tax=Betta splendens TaxID=158456 RepID=A0A6P7LJG4_BETSP|nr:macrophage mannose receptor 1-like [Betta splendens]
MIVYPEHISWQKTVWLEVQPSLRRLLNCCIWFQAEEKMKWTPFLVALMSQCSFSTCSLYQYHFIRETKTWYEAQTYCRETYTDLATVSDMTDMRRLCSSTQNQDEAWIGLHSYPGRENRKWHWSLPGLEFNDTDTRWEPGQPNDGGPDAPPGSLQNCGTINNQSWNDHYCNKTFLFLCYDGRNQSNAFHHIDINMTWPQAQSYCRQHYTDLVGGLDQLNDSTLASWSNVIIGLFRDTWRWSDGSNSSFRNWESLEDLVDGQSDKTCATVLNTAGTWSYDYCDEKKNLLLLRRETGPDKSKSDLGGGLESLQRETP